MAPTNSLPIHGNERTMNLNTLILTNIQSSPYFKVNLYELKTYHEVIDEIYYRVSHLEPWEKGSRKTAGQTGMCGGVRGVGAGGIVSSAYCLLYKLFTLRLTRKQVVGLITHSDSPYIRGLGFMYIRYTQPPADLWEWYEEYLDDDEEIDVKAGGGHVMMIGEMLRQWLQKLEWYSTLFPRIPVPVQKNIAQNMKEKLLSEQQQEMASVQQRPAETRPPGERGDGEDEEVGFGEAERMSRMAGRGGSPAQRAGPSRPSPPFDIAKEIEREKERHGDRGRGDRGRDSHRGRSRSRDRSRDRRRSRSKERRQSRSREKDRNHHKRSRSRERHDKRRSHSRERRRSRERRSRSRERRSRSRDKKSSRSHEKESHSRSRDKKRSRSRSRDRKSDHKHKKHRSRSRDRGSSYRESSYDRDLKREKSRVHRSENGD